ncbi:protein of unknown function (plasmid) [Azospirillum baldaniorum]|uniref:Uncharacterized protein n=1 Tax=Azospirillum baldaniorum TaxID=1064539 RepID=A0A9P1JX43_9PROT|nr:protein of unknown function [Azospirillum baldaniorum]
MARSRTIGGAFGQRPVTAPVPSEQEPEATKVDRPV